MADENEVFTKAEELIEWLDENDILMNLTDKEEYLFRIWKLMATVSV